MLNKTKLLFLGCWLLASSSSFAQTTTATTPKIETFTLKNGLEVIVIENHRIPAVNHTLWYKIGAADDPIGKSGLAHYHEHSMFLGTQKYKSGEYSKIITAHGGEQNAFTGHDATAYFVNIAKEELPLAMEMEADRMRGLVLDDSEMAKEKQVIIEERRMRIDNNPEALLGEQINATLFRNHPYRLPVIGWQHEMDGLTKKDVIDFHNKYYHPNNAILIVGGDVTATEVKKLAEKYYGDFKNVAVPARRWNEEPPQIAARRITMHHAQVSQPEWQRVYAVASLGYGKHEQALPLFILAQVLGGGKTSRLYSELVTKQKIATAISVDYQGFSKGIAEFSIDIIPAQNVDPVVAEAAADKEIAKLLHDGITPEELERSKTLLKADTIFARDGLSSMANIMGWVRMIGLDKDYFVNWPKLIDKITADEVLAAAKDNLKLEQSVTAQLLPEEKAEVKENAGKK